MHYHLIVHKEDVYLTKRDTGVSSQMHERAFEVADTIDSLIDDQAPNILEIPKGKDPRRIPQEINAGDTVTLYGAFHGGCLGGAYMSLMLRGANATYHPDGCL